MIQPTGLTTVNPFFTTSFNLNDYSISLFSLSLRIRMAHVRDWNVCEKKSPYREELLNIRQALAFG